MRHVLSPLLALLFVSAAAPALHAQSTASPPSQAPAPRTSELDRIIADFEAFERAEDPVTAGQEGDRAALARWGESTPAADARRRAALERFRSRLAAVPLRGLDADARLNHGFLSRIVAERLEFLAFDPDRLAFDFEGGPGQGVAYLADTTALRDRQDAQAWIARLEGVPKLYGDNTANLRRGLSTGWVQPKPVIDSALPILRNEAAFQAASDPFLKPFASLPATMPQAEREALRARAQRVIADRIVPARRDYLRFIETEYAPRARPREGVGSLKDGQRYYAARVKSFTTTDMTPEQVHQLGQREVERIRAEMDGVMRETNFKGSFSEFLTFLRTDPQFYATSREDLLEKASEIAKRADYQLPKLFGTLPRLPYGVIPTPREIEANTTTGRYYPGSPELGTAGGYLVNTGNLPARPLYELPALTVHEAVPGHHLQIALAQELTGLPYFRRNAGVTAFTEGWGLYSEHLGTEMGIYRTPYERFGKLSYEMWRACRLVADTGIHALGWTKEQARVCFRDNSALSEGNIEAELNRYIGWPGQALAYKVGELKLKELRARAERELGPRFDVRRFHDAVLLGGALPLSVLETRIDAWIAEQRRAG